jgi:hypothetical protein
MIYQVNLYLPEVFMNVILVQNIPQILKIFKQLWSSIRRSDLLVEKTGVPGENHRPAANHCQTLSHNVVSRTPRHERGSNSPL